MKWLVWFSSWRWWVTQVAIVAGVACFYALIGPVWAWGVNMGLVAAIAAFSVACLLYDRQLLAKAQAHRSAGELAFARANHAAAYQRHSRYTTASEEDAGTGLTAIKCCGCNAIVGVVDGEDEVQALAEAHVKEEAWKLRGHIEKVTK